MEKRLKDDKYIDLPRLRVRYRLEGSGPAAVLVHGVGGSLDDWNRVVAKMADNYTILRYDLRGHGSSGKLPGPYELDDFVADLDDLAESCGIGSFHLVGFSLGGLIAQGYALAHPKKVDRLILLSTVAGRNEDEKRRVLARLDIVADGIPGQHFENSVSRWFTEAFQRENPDVIAAYAERNRRNDPASYAAAYRVLATSDLADRLSEIRRPTLIATGEGDIGSNPRMARLMHEKIEGSELRIFPGLRHSILTEASALVASEVGNFLSAGAEARKL
jgi:pimeloyl-ACP methyl ester carboxylesterase